LREGPYPQSIPEAIGKALNHPEKMTTDEPSQRGNVPELLKSIQEPLKRENIGTKMKKSRETKEMRDIL